ncbi:MAG: hypothetical protein JW744_00700 [Candidatus Diapherotrites archaeon]|uniref:Holliday junction resolvase-related domain-containing protein n=1 Tax=Candidatus Iainarchaeum sp. TaxID=3101447 RepID=A0A938YML2_9ARCH|nr:hypothetical protein [Candidatus Diapherotrites archaeon]
MLAEFLAIAVFVLAVLVIFLLGKLFSLKEALSDLRFQKSSQSVKYGKMTEQFMPFLSEFPFDTEGFRFLGSPIDGIAFGDDEITFCEFKSGKSTLNERQKRVKAIVEAKRVKWREFNLR